MKNAIMLLTASLAIGSMASAKTASTDNLAEAKGTIQKFLMNPEGDVDGFILQDGSQINFPPHMSSKLTATVAPNDAVEIKGFRENKKVFHAEKITNVTTTKTVEETPPTEGPGERGAVGFPPPPPPPEFGAGGPPPLAGGPRPPHPSGKGPRAGLHELSANGKIEKQIFGRRGEVVGFVLSDNSIVRMGPRMQEDAKVKTEIGQTIKASGFGTENSIGKALEATELSNN